MATTVCSECPRSFKTESGLTWHLAHIHQLTGGDSVDVMRGEPMGGEIELLPVRVDDLGESMGTDSELVAEVSKIRQLIGMGASTDETIFDQVVRLREQVERLETELHEFAQLSRRIRSIELKTIALEQSLSDLHPIVSALRDLLWNLDMSHKKREFADLVPEPSSPERIKEARGVLRR